MLSEAILIFFFLLLPLSHAASINVLPVYQSCIWEKRRETARMEKGAREGGKEERKRRREIETDKLRDIDSNTAYILPWPCATTFLPLSLSTSRGLWEERLAFINKTIWRKTITCGRVIANCITVH